MKRIQFLDATRGILASVVVAHHILLWEGTDILDPAAALAVFGFFVLSGYVLARGYDGNLPAFFARRLIRLWPVYAVCLTCGYLLYDGAPTWQELIWWPTPRLKFLPKVDLAAWTLYIEAWATPLLPLMVWIAKLNRMAGLVAAVILFVVSLFLMDGVFVPIIYFAFFAFGVAGSRFEIAFPERVPRWALWLGKIGYSLFLSHWVVLAGLFMLFGSMAAIPAIPAIVLVAFVVWRTVERPSIQLSRWAEAVFVRGEPKLHSPGLGAEIAGLPSPGG